jgi:hypothetical protein
LHNLKKKYKWYVMKREGNKDKKNMCECDSASAIDISQKHIFLKCFETHWCGAWVHGTRLVF